MMKVAEMDKTLPWFIRAEQERLCPECGARMAEMDRLNEGNTTYVWYKCAKDNCNGQWMAKVPRLFYEINSRKARMVGSNAAATI